MSQLRDLPPQFTATGLKGQRVELDFTEGVGWILTDTLSGETLTDLPDSVILAYSRRPWAPPETPAAPAASAAPVQAAPKPRSPGEVAARDIRFARADGLPPTEEQARVLESIAGFIDDKKAMAMALVGYAGVGKTFLEENIARYAQGLGYHVAAVAPTNKAVGRIDEFFKASGIEGVVTSSLHKLLYRMSDDTPPRKMKRNIDTGTLVLLDESSLLSKEMYSDLMAALDVSLGSKVLFIGDNFQNEAVGEDANVLHETLSPLPPESRVKLVGLMRQKAGSNLGYIVTRMRATHTPAIPQSGVDDFRLHHSLASLSAAYQQSLLENRSGTVMIVGTNRERIHWNKVARKALFGAQASEPLLAGEPLISVANVGDISNSDLFDVVSPGRPGEDAIATPLPTRDKKGRVLVEFIRHQGARILVGGEERLATLYLSPEFPFPSLWQRELLEHMGPELKRALVAAGDLREVETAWGLDYRFAPDVVFASHAYAITGHKAQGSEWPNVFISQSFNDKWDMSRWLYTATTRARDRVEMLVVPSIHKPFDLDAYRAEMEQVPITFLEPPPPTHSLMRTVEDYSAAELVNRMTYGMANRAGVGSEVKYRRELMASYRREFDAIGLADTRAKAHAAVDRLVRDPDVWPVVDPTAESMARRWIDHKFGWTGAPAKLIDRDASSLRPSQRVVDPKPDAYVRPFRTPPDSRRHDTAPAISEEWREYHLEGVYESTPGITMRQMLALRKSFHKTWDAALAPFVEAPSYETAVAALADAPETPGLTPQAFLSMRAWARDHLPSLLSRAQQAYYDFGGDEVPDSVEGLAAPEPVVPRDVTHSITPVIEGFASVITPFRGGGGSALTQILAKESTLVSSEIAKVDRFFERRSVEWGLSGRIARYKTYTFKLGPDGKPGPYQLKGRALWGEWRAEKLTDDERKLAALAHRAAFMGLEYTIPDAAGNPKFDEAAAKARLRVLLPVGIGASLDALRKLLPADVALLMHNSMQAELERARAEAADVMAQMKAQKPGLADAAYQALYQRTLAMALGDVAAYTQARFSSNDGRAIPGDANLWSPRDLSYAVPYQVVLDALEASAKPGAANRLIGRLVAAGRDAKQLTIASLVDESAGMLDSMLKFANDRTRWAMSQDSPYMRHLKGYSPHYFGSGYYGPDERAIASRVARAVNWAKSAEYKKRLNPAGTAPLANRTIDDVPEFVWEALYRAHGFLAFPGMAAVKAALEQDRLSFMGLPKNPGYTDVVAALHSSLNEVFYSNAAAGGEQLDLLPADPLLPAAPVEKVADNALGLARALKTLLGSYKDREFTARAKKRFHKTFEEAFKVSGRRPSNMGVLDVVHKYSSDMLLATRNRIILNQLVQVTDVEGTPLVVPAPMMDAGMDADEEVFTQDAWKIVADRLALWFHDRFDPTQTPRENVDRLVRKYVDGSKSFTRVDSAYASVERFYTFTRGFGGENFLDALLAGGEAAGVLKHVVGKPWEDRFGILRTHEHINTWMKIQALQLSLFFPIAGQEGLVAMFGHKMITKDGELVHPILTQIEWRRMIKAGHPYAMQLMADAEAVGLQFSSTANPLGLPVGYIERDVDRLASFADEHLSRGAGSTVRTLGKIGTWQTNFMFDSYYNTIKLWTIYKFAEIERAKAEKAGRDFVFAEAMLPYVDYLNAEVGGTNWNRYSWMTPTVKRIMSLGMFSIDWTMSAWNAAGGGVLTGPLLKNYMTEEELKFIGLRRWPQMILYVQMLVPLLVQAIAYGVGLSLGNVEPDDEWLIFKNEAGRKLHADLTPLLRGMPWYAGDPSGKRRSYIRWGKQAYETQRWLEAPWESLMSKSSQIARWALEQASGNSGGAMNFPLPFKGEGLAGLVLDRNDEFWGSRLGFTLKKFAPFSLLAWAQNPDAAPLQILGPVSKGTSYYAATQAYMGILEAWARADTYGNIYRNPRIKANLNALGWEVLQAAERNGYDPAKVVAAARGAVLKDRYTRLYKGVNSNDQAAVEKAAREIVRLNGTLNSALSSAKNRNRLYGKPEKLTDAQRAMIREAFDMP